VLPEPELVLGIELARGFVQEEDLRIVGRSGGDEETSFDPKTHLNGLRSLTADRE